MTLIAVFSDPQATHVIADSLVRSTIENNVSDTADKWLSTGILIDKSEQLHYKFDEGVLKIWQLQANLVIAMAGDISLAVNVLSMLDSHCKSTPLDTFTQLNQFLHTEISNSISPVKGSCVLCGVIFSDDITTKFKITINSEIGLLVEHTTDYSEVYVVGTGSQDFLDIWSRMLNIHNSPIKKDPTSTFSVLAEKLYMQQFLGEKKMITERYTGGAICGVFLKDGKINWQPSRSIVIFANKGGTGLNAEFVWLRIVYKTWYEKGNVFSSSMFEINNEMFQRITQYSNSLSMTIQFSPDHLLDEMKTFNANSVSSIFLPKGLATENYAILRFIGDDSAFDEKYKNGRIQEIRLNEKFFQRVGGEIFVTDDYVINMGIDRLPPLINELRKQLDSNTNIKNPREWVERQNELAVRLIEYGIEKKDREYISEAISRFLDAYKVALSNKLDLLNIVKRNLNRCIEDLRKNYNNEKLLDIISGFRIELEKHGFIKL